MLGTKLEITLPKAEPGHWSNLSFPKQSAQPVAPESDKQEVKASPKQESGNDSDVDLEDLQPLGGMKLSDGKS